MHSPLKTIIIGSLLACMVFLSLPGCSGSGDQSATEKESAPMPVNVIKAQSMDFPIWSDFVAQVNAKKVVEIRARVEGFLLKKLFKEGEKVEQGQLLFEIDPKPFQETLTQTEAKLAKATAEMQKAEKDYLRFKELYKQGAVSKDEYEGRETDKATLEADVRNSNAEMEKAKIDLGYTKIHSPIDGVIGKVKVDVGNLVGKGENTLLAVVSSEDPIYVDFSISERQYLTATKYSREHKRVDSAGPPLKMVLADDKIYPYPGTVDMADRAVDHTTGTLGIRAVFPNPDNILKPGQYAKVLALIEVLHNATVIPSRALMDMQGVKYVYKVDDNGTIANQPVTIGYETDRLTVVKKGLAPGNMVIADGLRKVRPGMNVAPKVVPMDTKLEDDHIGTVPGEGAAVPKEYGAAENGADTAPGTSKTE